MKEDTQEEWEKDLAVLTSVMLGGQQFRELSPLIDFIRTLRSQSLEEGRESALKEAHDVALYERY